MYNLQNNTAEDQPELSEIKKNKKATLLVWDYDGSPPKGDWMAVLWSDFPKANDLNLISIPMLVEEQADVLKARYLSWIYDLGETQIKGKRLVDHMELRPGFSYWWMTLMAQRFNVSGTSNINDAIKLFVLEELIYKHEIQSVSLISGNRNLARVIGSYCKRINAKFQFKYSKTSDNSIDIVRKAYRKLPNRFQALIFFIRYLKNVLPNIVKKQKIDLMRETEICFIDIFVHLGKKAFKSGTFISNYWTSLVDLLATTGVKTNWLHVYFKHNEISSLSQAQQLNNRFNKCENQTHQIIESNLSISIFRRTLIDFYKLNRVKYNLTNISTHFNPDGSNLDLWPLFRKEWNQALGGTSAIMSCLRLSLFEKTLGSIPCQKLGIYIQENQPWEMALIYAWKAAGHGKLIGVPHTVIRYWDLRYFYDCRSYESTGKNSLPIPDLVAVNGPVAKKTYLNGGYSESQIIDVEALRYLHLLNSPTENTSIKLPRKVLNILICGDFLASTNYKMLSWVAIAAKSLPTGTSYVFKSHPAYQANLNDFPSLKLIITYAPLAELLEITDVVFTSNISSAAVDAYYFGTPVVQMMDGENFNTSPLRGLKGVTYITNPADLAEALGNVKSPLRVLPESYFFLDKELPRWRKLLGLNIPQSSCIVG